MKHCFEYIIIKTLVLGTPGGNRTPDALLRTEALCPLSYRGASKLYVDQLGLASQSYSATPSELRRCADSC